MAIDGWGLDGWGIEPWGGVSPLPPLNIVSAVAISTKELQVALNREAQVLAPTVAGDALNPASWVIQRLDTGFFFSVLSIRQTGPTVFVINVLQDWGSSLVTHRVLSTTLLDVDGNPISVPPLNQADYLGLLNAETATASDKAARGQNAVRDIANPQTKTTGELTTFGGTLVINDAGDYELEQDSALLKKLVLRRLTTQRGGFFHLPNYGVGLNVKGLLPAANLIKLRADIIRQVRREPEVAAAVVQLALGRSNVLTVRVQAQLKTGGTVDFSFDTSRSDIVL